MLEFLLALGITPVFLILGVYPGVIFVVVLLFLLSLEKGGFLSVVVSAIREVRAKTRAVELMEGPPPTSSMDGFKLSIQLYTHAALLVTSPDLQEYCRRVASDLHVCGWPAWLAAFREEHRNEEGIAVDPDVRMSDDMEPESGDQYLFELNTLMPVTTPSDIDRGAPATTEETALKAEIAAEKGIELLDELPDAVLSETYARVGLVWLCVRASSGKSAARDALRRAREWVSKALEHDTGNPLALLCESRIQAAAGDLNAALEALWTFMDTAYTDQRDYPGACFDAAELIYRLSTSAGELDVPAIRAMVERGTAAEEQSKQFWADQGLSLWFDSVKKSSLDSVLRRVT